MHFCVCGEKKARKKNKHLSDASNIEWKFGPVKDASVHQYHDALWCTDDYFIISYVWFSDLRVPAHTDYCYSSQAYFTFLCQQTKCLASHNPSIISCPTSCPAVFHGGISCDLSKVVNGFPHAGCGLKGIDTDKSCLNIMAADNTHYRQGGNWIHKSTQATVYSGSGFYGSYFRD